MLRYNVCVCVCVCVCERERERQRERERESRGRGGERGTNPPHKSQRGKTGIF